MEKDGDLKYRPPHLKRAGKSRKHRAEMLEKRVFSGTRFLFIFCPLRLEFASLFAGVRFENGNTELVLEAARHDTLK